MTEPMKTTRPAFCWLAFPMALLALAGCGHAPRTITITPGRGNLGTATVRCESVSAVEGGAGNLVQLTLLAEADCPTKPGLYVTVRALERGGQQTLTPHVPSEGVTLGPGKTRTVQSPPFARPAANTQMQIVLDAVCRNNEPAQGIASCVLL